MKHVTDEVTLKAKEAQQKEERKNYTYRLKIYQADLFALVCKKNGIQPVTLLEQWIKSYIEPYEGKYEDEVLEKIDKKIERKKESELKSRKKQKRKK